MRFFLKLLGLSNVFISAEVKDTIVAAVNETAYKRSRSKTIYAVSKDEILSKNSSLVEDAIENVILGIFKVQERLENVIEKFSGRLEKLAVERFLYMHPLVEFSISGYDRDARDLWEVPEVRKWGQRWLERQPHCPLFLDTPSRTRLLLYCFDWTRNSRDEVAPTLDEHANNICEQAGSGEIRTRGRENTAQWLLDHILARQLDTMMFRLREGQRKIKE